MIPGVNAVRIDPDGTRSNLPLPGRWLEREQMLRDDLGGTPRHAHYAVRGSTRGLCVITLHPDDAVVLPRNLVTERFLAASAHAGPAGLRGVAVLLGSSYPSGARLVADFPEELRARLHSLTAN
ncbi:hypothetical protein ACIQU6_38455 [Streptomyces sp. NPDC090442]|uniref:hypothetical protein n=1 Tax=Streptomyces sp. NPDC090442 TaxID=3365962 RepID=UPI00380808EB